MDPWFKRDGSWRPVSKAVQRHISRCRRGLGRSMARRARIYLDTRYWLLLRDVHLKRRQEAELVRLLAILKKAVAKGTAVCPVEAASFMELFGQRDAATRQITAQLMDELSNGVCLAPPQERRLIELQCFLEQQIDSSTENPAPSELVWSRVGGIFGEVLPFLDPIPPKQSRRLQINLYDHLWSLGISDFVSSSRDLQPPPMPSREMATLLNSGKDNHASEMRSFKGTYLSEVRGILDALAPLIDQVFLQRFRDTTGYTTQPTDDARLATVAEFQALLISGFRTGECSLELPSINILATLHASIRWDRTRRLRPNDFADLQHADAALPYCDVFLTEKPLQTLIESAGLSTLYNAVVVADYKEATDAVETAITQVSSHDGG